MMSRHSLLRKVEGAPASQVVRLSGWMNFDKWTAVIRPRLALFSVILTRVCDSSFSSVLL